MLSFVPVSVIKGYLPLIPFPETPTFGQAILCSLRQSEYFYRGLSLSLCVPPGRAVPCPMGLWSSSEPASPGYPCPLDLSLCLPHPNPVRHLERTEQENLIRVHFHNYRSSGAMTVIGARHNSLGRSSWSAGETAM